MTGSLVRRCIIGSSNGGAFRAASECIQAAGYEIAWTVITDRKCGLLDLAEERGHTFHQVCYSDPSQFSTEVLALIDRSGCEDVLLFYTRRLASPLIDLKRVWNIHPALLPAFPGLNGVHDAVSAGVRLIGATLHRVDEGLDTGPVEAQVAASMPSGITLQQANFLSYLQKVWLTLVWFERTNGEADNAGTVGVCPAVALCSPTLCDEKLLASFVQWVSKFSHDGR